MFLNYSLRDAERWAEFSGDYNPIHFDVAKAKQLGMDGLCVHGMRAMLDVKSALSATLEKRASASCGLVFSCRLREPVACGTPYQLSVGETCRNEQVQVSGKLLNAHTQQIGMSSKLTSNCALVLSPITQVKTLDGETLATLYAPFLAVQSQAAPLWNFLDALLFRQMVNDPATLETVHSIIPQSEAASLSDVFSQVQVVQTHHETYFSPRLLSPWQERQRLESLDYSIQPTLVMGEKNTGLVLLANIQAWSAGEPLMSVTVTLKASPLLG